MIKDLISSFSYLGRWFPFFFPLFFYVFKCRSQSRFSHKNVNLDNESLGYTPPPSLISASPCPFFSRCYHVRNLPIFIASVLCFTWFLYFCQPYRFFFLDATMWEMRNLPIFRVFGLCFMWLLFQDEKQSKNKLRRDQIEI